MNIIFATDDRFIRPTALAMDSLITCNPHEKFHFYVLTETLEQKNKEILQQILQQHSMNTCLDYCYLSEKVLTEFPVRKGDHISLATYYRIFIPSLLPESVHKVLYLDGDILCTDSIRSFYETNLSDYSTAAVFDNLVANKDVYSRLEYPLQNGYAGAGVLLINLDWWRKNNVQEKAVAFISEFPEKCRWHDQDALNKILNGTILFCPLRYNVYTQLYERKSEYPESFANEIADAIAHPVIVHFSTSAKPWHIESAHPFRTIWRRLYEMIFHTKCKLTHKYTGKIRFLRTLKYIIDKLGIKKYKEFKEYPEYDAIKKEIEQKLLGNR